MKILSSEKYSLIRLDIIGLVTAFILIAFEVHYFAFQGGPPYIMAEIVLLITGICSIITTCNPRHRAAGITILILVLLLAWLAYRISWPLNALQSNWP